MNNKFYTCLYSFGQLIKTVSRTEKIKLNSYFIVVHPGVPIFGGKEKAKPGIDFAADCPNVIKMKILNIYHQAFTS